MRLNSIYYFLILKFFREEWLRTADYISKTPHDIVHPREILEASAKTLRSKSQIGFARPFSSCFQCQALAS
jgi:hypothetical protein